MKTKFWGIAAIVISIALWAVFAWTWLVFVGPNSSIWDCRSGPFDLDVSGSIVDIIVVFFVPMSIVSLISNIILIKMKKVKTWGVVGLISSFGMILLYAIATPSLPISACKEADIPSLITFYCFFMLSVTSLISSIVLIRRNRKNIIDTIDTVESGSIGNGNLIDLPFPGAGLAVIYPFLIENGGRIEIQLSVPIADDSTSVGMSPGQPIKSRLKVTIRSDDVKKNFRNTQYIEEFKHYGGGGASRTYFYIGTIIELPRKGSYIIEIVNEDRYGFLENGSKTDGIIRLMRYVNLPYTGMLYVLIS